MRFLVITRPKNMIPRHEMAVLIDAMKAWRIKYAGKLEHIWGFAGAKGGGGIANVSSLEELDELMAGFPFQGTSDVEIIPLVDLNTSLHNMKPAFQAMNKGMN